MSEDTPKVDRFWFPFGDSALESWLDDRGWLRSGVKELPRAGPDHPRTLDEWANALRASGEGGLLLCLGPAGAGKSFELKRWTEREGERPDRTVLHLDWVTVPRGGLLQRLAVDPGYERWISGARRELVLAIDGLDDRADIPIRRSVRQLADFVRAIHRESSRLTMVVTCRTTAWGGAGDDEWRWRLEEAWEGAPVRVIEIAPLSPNDAIAIFASPSGTARDRETLETAVDAGLSPIIRWPLGLTVFAKVSGGNAPLRGTDGLDAYELFDHGCRALLAGADHRDAEPGTVDDLLEAAGLLAAVALLGGRGTVLCGPADDPGPAEVALADLAGELARIEGTSEGACQRRLETVLDTPLFTGSPGVRWEHAEYPAFLCARFLRERAVSTEQVLELLRPGGCPPGVVAPHLVSLAGWLSMRDPDVARAIARQRPEILLASHANTIPEDCREAAVDGVLDAVEAGRIPRWVDSLLRGRHLLAHRGMTPQLLPHLSPEVAKLRRIAAILMAGATKEGPEAAELGSRLVSIALNTGEDDFVRSLAIDSAAKLGSAVRQCLLPVLESASGEDLLDRVRGTALRVLWPEELSTTELFERHLHPKRRTLHFGAYDSFLFSLASHVDQEILSPEEQEVATEWALRVLPLGNSTDLRVRVAVAVVRLALGPRSQVGAGIRRQLVVAWLVGDVDRPRPWAGWPLFGRWPGEDIANLVATGLDAAAELGAPDARDVGVGLIADALERLLLHLDLTWVKARARRAAQPARAWWEWALEVVARHDAEQSSAAPAPAPPGWSEREIERARKRMGELLDDAGTGAGWPEIGHLLMTEPEHRDPHLGSVRDYGARPLWTELEQGRRDAVTGEARAWLEHVDDDWSRTLGEQRRPPKSRTVMWALGLLHDRGSLGATDLGPTAWARLAPLLLDYWLWVDDDDLVVVQEALHGAACRAPDAVLDALETVLGGGEDTQVHGALRRLRPALERNAALADRTSALVFDVLEDGETPQKAALFAADAVLSVCERARTRAETVVAETDDAAVARPILAALLRRCPATSWEIVWSWLEEANRGSQREFVEQVREWMSEPAPAFVELLEPDQLAKLYSVLVHLFPPDDSRSPFRGGHGLASEILGELRQRSGDDARVALQRLRERATDLPFLAAIEADIERNTEREAWAPLELPDVLRLGLQDAPPVVRNDEELLRAVLLALDEVQEQLRGGGVDELWNRLSRNQPSRGQHPKGEIDLRNSLVRRLTGHRLLPGVAPSKEHEQVSSAKGRRGEHVDILLQKAVRRITGEVGLARCMLEVKGCWNKGVVDDLKGQLVDRYLHHQPRAGGIYLVFWFDPEEWELTGLDDRLSAKLGRDADQVRRLGSRRDLLERLEKQAEDAGERTVEVRVLDCSFGA